MKTKKRKYTRKPTGAVEIPLNAFPPASIMPQPRAAEFASLRAEVAALREENAALWRLVDAWRKVQP